MTIGSAIGREIDLDQLVRGVAAILPNAILYLWTGSLVWFEGALVTMSLLIVLTRAGPSLGLLLLFVHLLALWPISLVSVALVMRPPLAPNAGGRTWPLWRRCLGARCSRVLWAIQSGRLPAQTADASRSDESQTESH